MARTSQLPLHSYWSKTPNRTDKQWHEALIYPRNLYTSYSSVSARCRCSGDFSLKWSQSSWIIFFLGGAFSASAPQFESFSPITAVFVIQSGRGAGLYADPYWRTSAKQRSNDLQLFKTRPHPSFWCLLLFLLLLSSPHHHFVYIALHH